MASLPSFLDPLPSRPSHGPYANAFFDHAYPLAPAHCLWWPPLKPGRRVETIVLFIPGNPGLLDFYTPFLTALQDKDLTENLAILAHAHIDHTPGVYTRASPHSRHSLTSQVQSAIEAFDALSAEFPIARVMIIGHSVGAWVALQVLKERSEDVAGVFLLFPTICHIAKTPNGRKLSTLFKPFPRRIISRLSVIGKYMPLPVLHRLVGLEWPINQLKVLLELIRSPQSISAALLMGHEEMLQIRDLDVNLLQENRHRLWFYFADHDDWVGKQRHHILSNFKPDSGSLRITFGEPFIPHAFCINHGEEVARQCHQWLLEMNINLSLS
ncbi:hypothetical protein Agabi119p4_171 [Agaricus bisporus var. burnettii]|uniref:Uncharacterized protein n=1 Tax=Agaricus bisporus var. burnettii TaxID=192524 RepID=A0A8H7FA99_AGABI|nr:hypothetical protein AGABI2DRAFT_189327 [Agaricus bisporus var. bisporus H97]EKV51016.1 hypothetical protein AGABI2DRAFT_189327 [Agaricus bisporus var. bisporus H97]KAF7784006.1 hypothetical protein Agabi119p4_171 [Agaricus bisporus var. burnettii]